MAHHSWLSTTVWGMTSAMCLMGCTTPYKHPILLTHDNSKPSIQGIKQILASQHKDRPEMDIIAVHGMCTHDSSWAIESINALSEQLGAAPVESIAPTQVEASDALIYKRSLNLSEGTVNIAALVWSPVLTPLKAQLCYDQSNKTGVCGRGSDKPDFLPKEITSPDFKETRALVNRLGKDRLMDDCLADAVAYQGRAREGISLQVQEAILAAAVPGKHTRKHDELRTEVAARHTPLVIFTSSLGSKVGFDAIDALRAHGGADNAAAEALFTRVQSIFMSANQIPILQLADQTLEEAGDLNVRQQPVADDSLARLLSTYAPRMRLTTEGTDLKSNTPLVVFLSDPNDLLSYSLRNSPRRPAYATVDVVVSNARTWFGLLENPLVAHTGYLAQPEIAEIVVNGYKPDADDN